MVVFMVKFEKVVVRLLVPAIVWDELPIKLIVLAAPAVNVPLLVKFPLMFNKLVALFAKVKVAEAFMVMLLQTAVVPAAIVGW